MCQRGAAPTVPGGMGLWTSEPVPRTWPRWGRKGPARIALQIPVQYGWAWWFWDILQQPGPRHEWSGWFGKLSCERGWCSQLQHSPDSPACWLGCNGRGQSAYTYIWLPEGEKGYCQGPWTITCWGFKWKHRLSRPQLLTYQRGWIPGEYQCHIPKQWGSRTAGAWTPP